MSGVWTHRFEVILRPLRDRQGAQQTIHLETRTAAQATREATARFPDMKVISVTRVQVEVPSLKPQTPAVRDDRRVIPLRRVGS